MVARTDRTTTDAALPVRYLRQYLRKGLAQREAKYVKLDDMNIQPEEFVISV